MSLEGLALPVFPPVSYALHEHCRVKRGGARLAGSNCLAKGQRAGSGEAKKKKKKQLQRLSMLSYPRGQRSRGYWGLSRAQP